MAIKNSFNEIMEEVKTLPTVRRLIIRENRVDSFTTVRTRKVLTPSMCTKPGCIFDAAKDFDGWENVPEEKQSVITQVLEQHDKVFHNNSESYIIDEDQLPTEWLGKNT